MRGVVVTTASEISVREFEAPLYESVGEVVGGYIEIVRPMGLKRPYCMIVNDEGLLRGLPVNPLASELYGVRYHGQPIVGTAVFMKDGYTEDGPDIVSLTNDEAEQIFKEFNNATRPFRQLQMMKGETRND